eukprot:4491022-Pyramimonas_sp.AAC.1
MIEALRAWQVQTAGDTMTCSMGWLGGRFVPSGRGDEERTGRTDKFEGPRFEDLASRVPPVVGTIRR